MRRYLAFAAIALFACVLGFMLLAGARGDIAGRHPRQPTDTVVVAPTASHADDQADRLRSLEQRVEALTADLEALRGEHRLARPGLAVQQSPQTPAPTEEDAFLAQHRDSILGLIDDDARRRAFESEANALRQPLQRAAEHYHWDAAALTPIVLDYRRRISISSGSTVRADAARRVTATLRALVKRAAMPGRSRCMAACVLRTTRERAPPVGDTRSRGALVRASDAPRSAAASIPSSPSVAPAASDRRACLP